MLPAPERLRRSSLFQRTYAGKKSITSSLVTLYVLSRQARSTPRLPLVGFVAAKKVHNKATARNLVKRRVREAYRLVARREASVKQWYAMVWVIHSKALTASWQEICRVVADCTARADLKYGQTEAAKRVEEGSGSTMRDKP